jgi:Ca-activated chloride channel family protein
MGEDYYEVLGISKSATSEEIRHAYFDLVRKYHPDLKPGSGTSEFFFTIQVAYETLSNPKKRIEYDRNFEINKEPEAPIDITWTYSRQMIPCLSEPQLFYAKMDINLIDNGTLTHYSPIHFCVVLDSSTSMKGERIESIKSSIKKLISNFRPHDMFSVITFNDNAEMLISPTHIINQNQLMEKIDGIKVSGGTEIFKGLKAGVDLLWQGKLQLYTPSILLLTDGHTYGDEDACYSLAKKAADNNISIYALGFGSEWNDRFLDKLTAITGGSTYFVESLDLLSNLVMRFVENISTIFANGVILDCEHGPEILPQFIYRLKPDVVQVSLDPPFYIGELFIEKSSSFLFAFKISQLPKDQERISILKGKIRMQISSPKKHYAEKLILLTLPVTKTIVESPIPLTIVNYLSRINLFQMQEKTKQDVDNGNINIAIRRLGHLASQLNGHGEEELAKEVLKEVDRIKTHQIYSEDGNKRLKYGTRGLLLLPEPEKRKQ